MPILQQETPAALTERLQLAEAVVADQASSITYLKLKVAALEQQLLAKELPSSRNEIFVAPPPQDFNPLQTKPTSQEQLQFQARTPPLQLKKGLTLTPVPPPAHSPVEEIVVDNEISSVNRLMSCLTMDNAWHPQDSDTISSSSSSGILTRRPTPYPSLPSVSEGLCSTETSPHSDFRKGHMTNSRCLTSMGDLAPPPTIKSHVSDHSDGTTMVETLPAVSPNDHGDYTLNANINAKHAIQNNTVGAAFKFSPTTMVVSEEVTEEEEENEEEEDCVPSLMASTSPKKGHMVRTDTPLPGTLRSVSEEILPDLNMAPTTTEKGQLIRKGTPLPGTLRNASEETLPTSNLTRTSPALTITEEDQEEEDESVANAVPDDKNFTPPLRGPARTSTPLPVNVAPRSRAYSGDVFGVGDSEKDIPNEQEPRPLPGRGITSNAVRGLRNENSILLHGDDDDITMASDTIRNELSQTKEVHKRQVIDAFGERGMYTGSIDVKSYMPDGYGEMQYRQKRSYQGDWCQGNWHGHGKFLNSVDNLYEGEFAMNKKCGQGKLIFNDGRVFIGRFKKDQMREGKMNFQDGSSYEGLLKDGKRCGFGLYVFSDESQYGGQWENDLFHGRGRMDWTDGGWYNGDWEEGLQHGIGLEAFPNRTIRHKGKWDKGNPVHEAVHIG